MCHSYIHLVKRVLFTSFILLFSSVGFATSSPFLAFSDLISGPDTGVGDGLGSGAIVTVWGQGLGSLQGESKIYFTDSQGVKREAAHVYYWKNADGDLPSGPANLYESHKMQEIAFSIPDSAAGPGKIHVETPISSNSIDFTVRAGEIYFVRSSGSDSASGTWSAPWQSVDHADHNAPAGATIYLLDVTAGSTSSRRGIFWSNTNASSTLAAQFSIVAYPGFRPTVYGQQGVQGYRTEAMVTSKLDIYASNYLGETASGQPTGEEIDGGSTYGIFSTKDGRAVANRIGDIPGGCASKYQGAIVGAASHYNYVSNFKIFGNEVYEYGCEGSTKLHHTMYMTIRSGPDDLQVEAWEYGYNYLHDNWAKFGIHQFDQDDGCGDLTTTLKIHNNVVTNQGGAGISVGSQCGWSMDVEIYNNVLINVGLAADWDGVDPDTSDGPENGGISIRDSGLFGTVYVYNNLIHEYTGDGATIGPLGCLAFQGRGGDNVSVDWSNNICVTTVDQPFMGAGYLADAKYDNVVGSNNFWFDGAGSSSNDNIPTGVTNSSLLDPMVILNGALVSYDENSPLIDNGRSNAAITRDIYGNLRTGTMDIGPIEFAALKAPPLPPGSFSATIIEQ